MATKNLLNFTLILKTINIPYISDKMFVKIESVREKAQKTM
jgi:hypothetical protein